MITKLGEEKTNQLISQEQTQGTQEITVPNVFLIQTTPMQLTLFILLDSIRRTLPAD